jgi:hypothetical protein
MNEHGSLKHISRPAYAWGKKGLGDCASRERSTLSALAILNTRMILAQMPNFN